MKDNRALVVMGKMTLEQWDEYVKGIVESADYKQVVSELKELYSAQK